VAVGPSSYVLLFVVLPRSLVVLLGRGARAVPDRPVRLKLVVGELVDVEADDRLDAAQLGQPIGVFVLGPRVSSVRPSSCIVTR
jgi:hypothetical protein